MRHLAPILMVALLAAGCATLPIAGPTPGGAGAAAQAKRPAAVTAKGAMRIAGGKGFGLKALVTPNNAAALHHVEVWLSRESGDFQYLGSTSNQWVVVNNLKLDSHYAVRLKAFKEDPNAPGAYVCMSDDEPSTTNFHTFPDWSSGAPTYQETLDVSFALRLSDQTFAGTAQGNVSLTEGTLSSTWESERLGGMEPFSPPPSDGPSPMPSGLPDGTGMLRPAFVRFNPVDPVVLMDLGEGDPCAPQISSNVTYISFGTYTVGEEWRTANTFEVTCGEVAPALTPPPTPEPTPTPEFLPDATGMAQPMFVRLEGIDLQYRLVDWAVFQAEAEGWCPTVVRTGFGRGTRPVLVDGVETQVPVNDFVCWYPQNF